MIMYEPILAGAALVLLLILCLPFAGIHKLVLEVYALALRLALLALLVAGALLWFYPERLPAEVTEAVDSFPPLRGVLPEPGTPLFGPCAAALVVAVLLPFLAAFDVTRKLAGRRLTRLRALTAGPVVAAPPPPAPVQTVEVPPAQPAPPPVVVRETAPAPRHADRRTAADTLAAAGAHKPFRYAGPER
jgi:hypothetical protein